MSRLTVTSQRRILLPLCACMPAMLLFGAAVEAMEVEAAYSLGVGYSDNIDRVPEDGQEETIAHTGVSLALTHNTRRIRADVRGTLNYYEYTGNTYEGDLVAALTGLLDLNLVEDRLTWTVQNNYGRALFDPFLPARPENWENLNFFTTGPDISLLRWGRNLSGISLRYSQMDYEMRPFDNDRRSATFWIGREIRRDQILSLNAEVEKIEFSNGITPEYERRSAYLRYAAETGRNIFSVDAGYTEQEIRSETADGVRFNLAWTRELSTRSQLTLNIGRQFADQGTVFRYQQDITRDLDSIGDVTENGSPFQLDNIDIVYTLNGERTMFSARAGAGEQEYELQNDRRRRDARFEFFARRDLTRNLFVTGRARLYQRDFPNLDREDDTWVAGVGIGWRFSASLDLSLSYARASRDSNVPANEFDENRGDLTLSYTPLWAR